MAIRRTTDRSGATTREESGKDFGPNGGSIINISSIASAGEAQAAIYSGTKDAIDAIARELAVELGPRKIRVNAIAPGGIETEFRSAAAGNQTVTLMKHYASRPDLVEPGDW
jgi:NAD(P)-dependent dehydrogenase (short-subunit alcohol dehydrogenase family)